MKFGSQFCFALLSIAIVAATVFAQTPSEQDPPTSRTTSLQGPNLLASKTNSTDADIQVSSFDRASLPDLALNHWILL